MIVVRRRGRKRKNADRHPGGKIRQRTRQERADEVMSVARQGRRRVHGLSAADAARPEAGDMFGRLLLSGEITQRQHDAGRAYAELSVDYDKAMGARRLKSAGDLNPSSKGGFAESGPEDPDTVAWYTRKVEAFGRARHALLSVEDPLALTVVDGIVLEGRTMWNHIGTLRLGLNALARVFVPVSPQ